MQIQKLLSEAGVAAVLIAAMAAAPLKPALAVNGSTTLALDERSNSGNTAEDSAGVKGESGAIAKEGSGAAAEVGSTPAGSGENQTYGMNRPVGGENYHGDLSPDLPSNHPNQPDQGH